MSVFVDVDDEIGRLQEAVDKLDDARAVAQNTINDKATGLILGHLQDQAEKIHELLAHVGSYGGCYQADCIESRRLEDSIKAAARGNRR